MSRGTPVIAVRLDDMLRSVVLEYQKSHNLADLSSAVREIVAQGCQTPSIGVNTGVNTPKVTAEDVLTWWDRHMQLYKSQKWYPAAREALAEQV